MPASKTSIDEAKPDKLFYVVANTIIYREEDGRCLILKRDMREKVHPGKWASVGGKLEHKDLDIKHPSHLTGDVLVFEDSINELLVREAKEEAGVTIKMPAKFMGTKVIVRPDGIPVVLLKFAVVYDGGEVRPEAGGFTDSAWVNADEVKDYDILADVAAEIRQTTKLFQKEMIKAVINGD